MIAPLVVLPRIFAIPKFCLYLGQMIVSFRQRFFLQDGVELFFSSQNVVFILYCRYIYANMNDDHQDVYTQF